MAAMTALRDYELLDAIDCPVCGQASCVVPVADEASPDRLCVDCGTALFVDPVVRVSA